MSIKDLRVTHTYAILEVSQAAYDEVAAELRNAMYHHVFHDDFIDMNGIALAVRKPNESD